MEQKAAPKELWRPTSPESTDIYKFKDLVSCKYNLPLVGYDALWKWSITEPANFWGEVWDYTNVKAAKPYETVLERTTPLFPRPTFFKGALLNFAENLLFPTSNPDENSLAIIAATESKREYVTWKDLRERVRLCAAAMEEAGVTEGDRVAGFVGHHTNALVAMLAATSLGALWTAVSPDTGVHAVLERLQQIQPIVLFADNAAEYNGKIHDGHAKVVEVVKCLPSLKFLVVFESIKGHEFDLNAIKFPGKSVTYDEFLSFRSENTAPLKFRALTADHPVYILFSSGTTGAPKPIVHGAIGTLLQHKKEHVLHCDMGIGDRLFYFTTVTWMMWHWLVSALASGVTLILYDGSPFRPLDAEDGKGYMAMPRLIDELQITHFGTSAKYLSILEQADVNPTKHPHRPVTLKSLRAIFSTAAPLAPSTFEYVYSSIKPDLMLGSITGGTDIISLFGASCPILPVYRGEIQCRALGMAVASWDYTGNDITSTNEPGDLVCTVAFPAQPVMFWPPGLEGQEKYCSSYFDKFGDAVWHHGDFVHINPQTGGLYMLGRSDGVLKPAGVRFGSSEIYNVVLEHFANEVEDSLCVGRRREGETDEVVVLFLKLHSGTLLSPDLAGRIKATIRKELSPRHVPTIIDSCPGIPITMNGKKIENIVKQILCGLHMKTGTSVANPECLDFFRDWTTRN